MEFNQMVAMSGQVRQCKIQPDTLLTQESNSDGTVVSYLPYQAKALWFGIWCVEVGKTGWIDDSDVTIQPVSDSVAMATVKATVYINDQVAGRAVGSKAFFLNDVAGISAVVQAAGTVAKSRALANAGFGVVSSSKPEEPPIPLPEYLLGQQNTPKSEEPVSQMPVSLSPTPNYGNYTPMEAPMAPGPGPAAPNLGGYAPAPQMPMNPAPAGPLPGMDPVTIAKQTVYPGRGIYSGKTLGEILASSPKQILWIADKYPNPTVKEAASLLVPEARRLTGM